MKGHCNRPVHIQLAQTEEFDTTMASVIDTVVSLCKRRGLVYQAG